MGSAKERDRRPTPDELEKLFTYFDDVDLLIEPKDEEFSLFDMMHVQDACTELLGRPAELHDCRGLARTRAFQASVRPDLVNVF